MKHWPQLESLLHHDDAPAVRSMPPRDPSVLAADYSPAAMSRRRIGNLAVFLVVAAIASAMGYVRWEVPLLLIPWIAGVWVAMRASASTSSPHQAEWIEAASYCLNAVLLTFATYYLGGARSFASAFYVLLVMTAAAELPMRKAALVTVVAWLGFAILSLGHAAGIIVPPGFTSSAPSRASMPFAVLSTIVVGVTLLLALLLQESLLGALRRSEARHRAILSAASDMVVVLDRDGTIQGASEVFAQRTALPTRTLVGTRFGSILDTADEAEWSKALVAAARGEQVTFKLAYRSTYATRGWIAGTLVPLPPEKGSERILMVARDVSAEHRTSTTREARIASEVATARLASLDGAIREVVRDLDGRLGKVLRGLGAASSAAADTKAQAILRATTEDIDAARHKAHELVTRLDMFKETRQQPGAERSA